MMKQIGLAMVVAVLSVASGQAAELLDSGHPLALVLKTSVQKDLELTAEQIKEVEPLLKEANGEDKMTSAMKTLSKSLKEEQMKRLKEIMVQVNGGASLRYPEVQKTLKFTEQQSKKIQDIMDNKDKDIRMMMAVARFRSPEAMRNFILEQRKQSGDKLLEVLTAEQKKSLDGLKGKKFEVTSLSK